MKRNAATFVVATLLFALLAGCANPPPKPAPPPPPPPAAAPAAPPPPPPAPPPPPPPLVAVPFPDAVARAGKRLFEAAAQNVGKTDRVLVVDPLIDASSGQQTIGTQDMGKLLVGEVRAAHPYWAVRPFTRETVNATPLLLIGTLTAINTKNNADEAADAFRICLRLVDLRTGKVVARALDRATAETVNAEPLPVFRDSPTWHKDKTVNGYIKSCQGTQNVGDPIDPPYVIRLQAAAVINEAHMAFAENRLNDAARIFKEASAIADPDDLRVLNGLYLSNWRLGRQREAGEVFHKIALQGITNKQLPVKLLFAPGKALPLALPDLAAQYGLWVREVAQVSQAEGACLRVIGHTSKSGSATANDALSLQRATYVQNRLVQSAAKLRGKIVPAGLGSRENLIGLGTDDLRDALDRRVEFRVIDCDSVPKTTS